MTSGWNCTPYRPRSGSSIAATGALAVRAVTVNPAGRRAARVAVRHPHRLLGGQPGEQRALPRAR